MWISDGDGESIYIRMQVFEVQLKVLIKSA